MAVDGTLGRPRRQLPRPGFAGGGARLWCRVALWLLLAGRPVGAQPVFSAATVGGPASGETGELYLPPGRGPYAAVIVLHGCDGVRAQDRTWARRLRGWGYAALLIDSFSSRGVGEVCSAGRRVDPAARAQDAFRAAAWLRGRGDMRAQIGLIGFSHGGWSVLTAVLADAPGGQMPFAAAVACYPDCEAPQAKLITDTLILIGAADSWTPASRCARWAAQVDRAGHALELRVLPRALHGFDTTAPLHMHAGHPVGGDAAAAAIAEQATRAFLAARLRPHG